MAQDLLSRQHTTMRNALLLILLSPGLLLVHFGNETAKRERMIADQGRGVAAGNASNAAAGVGLSHEEVESLEAIAGAFGAFTPFLLHGVTGSGKTEVYLRAIAQARAAGKGALVLVPEIALTPQLSGRFRARFGDDVALLHSGLSAAERHAEWLRLRRGDARICVGVRSAIFAPVQDLAVLVVDDRRRAGLDGEALREQVKQETAQELVRDKRHGFLFVAVRPISPQERDLAVVEGNEPTV